MDHPILFRIAARGLIIENNRLLCVSNDGKYWYLPGGKVEGKESLSTCVEREVYEETGLIVKTGALLHVLECFDLNDGLHKINFYFQTSVLSGSISDSWLDENSVVQFRRYFSLPEIIANKHIFPRFLSKGEWCSRDAKKMPNVYQGAVVMRGFEMVDDVDEHAEVVEYSS